MIRTAVWLAFALLIVALTPISALAETRVALVVGNSNYENVPRLPSPQHDAADIAGLLKKIGFDVTLAFDQTYEELRRTLAAFQGRADRSDIAVVYYAGHGIQVDSRTYLIPIDAQLARAITVQFEAISLDMVLSVVEGAGRLRLVILDACRDNPLTASWEPTGTACSISRGLSRVEAPIGTLVSFAAIAGTVAEDGDGRNSPFTAALLATLAEPVEIGLLFRRVRDNVISATDGRQVPYVSALLPSDPIFLVSPPTTRSTEELADRTEPDNGDRQGYRSFGIEPETPQPRFPWPPPQASASYVIPHSIVAGHDARELTWGDIESRLAAALDAAGYFDRSFYFVPSGFAMATRLEQIDTEGNPVPEPNRWPTAMGEPRHFSLAGYLAELFFARPGFYRVIVFVATPLAFAEVPSPPTAPEATDWVRSGLNVLPSDARDLPYTAEFTLTALIYEFRHSGGREAEHLVPSRLPGRTHLERGRIISFLSD